LFPWKTVYENVSLGLELRGFGKRERKEIVSSLLKDLNLQGFERYYPKQLSGGMQQRVAFARALALTPKILLMDEPLSSLDALTRENLQNFLLQLWEEKRMTVLLVTHSIEEAVFLGKKVVVLSQRPGTVLKTVDNPRMGDLDYRTKEEFFDKCREVRQSLDGGAI
jgi:NitT/TauT family transport system ATP-binding protein